MCIYDCIVNGFKMSSEMQQGDWVNSLLKGMVGGSFVVSVKEVGLISSEISVVIKVMQWQMDFCKLKKGDEFLVLMLCEMLDGKCEQSQLLGVWMCFDGKDYYVICVVDGKFYDCNGVGLVKGFLCFLIVKQFCIFFNFNLCCLNLVIGCVVLYCGVDFVMLQGMLVLLVGDGEVVVVKCSGVVGYYIVICYGCIYIICYMYLCKLLVKLG